MNYLDILDDLKYPKVENAFFNTGIWRKPRPCQGVTGWCVCVPTEQAGVPGSEQPELRVWLGSLLWGDPVLQLLLRTVVWVLLVVVIVFPGPILTSGQHVASIKTTYLRTKGRICMWTLLPVVCVLTGVYLQGSGWCGPSSLSWYAAAFSSTGVRTSASSSSAARMRSTSSPTEKLTTILTCPFISASILVSQICLKSKSSTAPAGNVPTHTFNFTLYWCTIKCFFYDLHKTILQ